MENISYILDKLEDDQANILLETFTDYLIKNSFENKDGFYYYQFYGDKRDNKVIKEFLKKIQS